MRSNAAALGRRDMVCNSFMRNRLFNLPCAGVGRMNALEIGRQSQRGLAVAGGAIPRLLTCRSKYSQVFKQCRGIVRAVFRVVVGLLGEVVFEGHGITCRLTFRLCEDPMNIS